MKFGSIKQEKLRSPIQAMACVRPKKGSVNLLKMAAPLMLTSLVDAFAVIVIYLLVSTQQAGKDVKIDKEISLPQASQSQTLKPGVNIQVLNNKYVVNETEMNAGELLTHLQGLQEELKQQGDERAGNLVIQADKASDYSGISPVLAVAAQSGFENIKFAVIGK